MYFLSPSDFKGFYNISQQPALKADFQYFIEECQDEMFCSLFGLSGATHFVNDYDEGSGTFGNDKYQFIFDPFETEGDACCHSIKSLGIKKMLLCFTYSRYVAEYDERSTAGGHVRNGYSDSDPLSFRDKFYNIERRYNKGVDIYNSILCYIINNIDDYPAFKNPGCSIDYLGIIL